MFWELPQPTKFKIPFRVPYLPQRRVQVRRRCLSGPELAVTADLEGQEDVLSRLITSVSHATTSIGYISTKAP